MNYRFLGKTGLKMRKLAAAGEEHSFARWALRFVLAHPAVSTAISRARNPQQAETNCAASDGMPMP